MGRDDCYLSSTSEFLTAACTRSVKDLSLRSQALHFRPSSPPNYERLQFQACNSSALVWSGAQDHKHKLMVQGAGTAAGSKQGQE